MTPKLECPDCGNELTRIRYQRYYCDMCGWKGATRNPREKGEDDGIEYSDPRDEKESRYA